MSKTFDRPKLTRLAQTVINTADLAKRQKTTWAECFNLLALFGLPITFDGQSFCRGKLGSKRFFLGPRHTACTEVVCPANTRAVVRQPGENSR